MMDDNPIRPRLAPDIFVIPLGARETEGRALVYAPLVRAAFETNATGLRVLQLLQAERLEMPAGESGRSLARFLDFLRVLEILDPRMVFEPAGEKTGEFAPTGVTLFLTTRCNLRCTYCYAGAGDTPSRTMSWDVACAALRFVQANASRTGAKSIQLMFHGGGEPTVAWPLFVRAVEHMEAHCREAGITLDASLSTNGVLTDGQIDYILKHCTGLNISYDGLPDIQNAQRPRAGGQGSWDAVHHTLKRLDAADFGYGIRMTITRRSTGTMVPSAEWIARNYRPRVVHMEPAFLFWRCTEENEPPPEFPVFLESFRACRKILPPRGVPLHYSGINPDNLTSHFCGVTQDSFAVTTEGRVSACYETFLEEDPKGKEFFYGHLDRATGEWCFDLDQLARLRKLNVQERAYCRDCFVKWHCAGDCHHRTSETARGGPFRGTPRCLLNQELTKDLLIERIQAGGGAWKEQKEMPRTAAT